MTNAVIQEQVLAYLRTRPTESLSSSQIHANLQAMGASHHIENVREALAYLLDARKIQFNAERKYQLETRKYKKMKSCRRCKGSGNDPRLPQRYTTGGHNDRSCENCGGEGVIVIDER